ncbi:MAG: GAF domain-containing protein, partial [Actinomycetota bacterium]|nr:GAF domain-containing protein [Actinomycetota bacterium]
MLRARELAAGRADALGEAEDEQDPLAALYRISEPEFDNPDPNRVISGALSAVAGAISCDQAVVWLFEKETDEFVLFSPDLAMGRHVPMAEQSVFRRVFQTGRGEVVNDVVADPDHSPILDEILDARQVVSAPLDVAGHRFGVIGAVNAKLGTFSENDLKLLTVVADRAALAIENARLNNTVQRQGQELEGLQRLSRLFTSAENVDNVVSESVRIVCDLIDCGGAALLMHDPDSDSLIAHPRVVGIDEEEAVKLFFLLSEPSLVSTAYRTDAPLTSNKAREDKWVDEQLRQVLDPSSVLVAPLSTSGKPLGVLLIFDSQKGHFDPGDERFATLLGSRVASVIEASAARERERALVQRLREADQTKSEFVSMLAHELKGPMTAIKGFGEILETQWHDLPDDRRNRTFQIMSKEIGRLSRLVNDLLDLSRMEAGTLRYEIDAVSLRELVDTIVSIHPSVSERHALQTVVSDDLPKVLIDQDRIRQVFLNLLSNAARHSPDGTTITIGADLVDEQDSSLVLVRVEDRGIGIPPEDRKRIFDKFAMLPKPGWIAKGTGLGLYITKGIVEAHGGRL